MEKWVKKSLLFGGFFAGIFLLASASFVHAADVSKEVEIELNVEPMMTVKFSENLNMIKATMIPDRLDVTKVVAEIHTNSRTGYTAYLSTDKKRKNEEDIAATGLVHIVDDTKIIPTLESDVTAENFPVNHWGYSTDGENYRGMNAANDMNIAAFTSSDALENRDMDLYFATKIDSEMSNGYYENTIIVTSVANYVPRTISDITYMQELDNETAISMVVDQQYRLTDIRNNKQYWIARLQDGNVWMTQDLNYVPTEADDYVMRADPSTSDLRTSLEMPLYIYDYYYDYNSNNVWTLYRKEVARSSLVASSNATSSIYLYNDNYIKYGSEDVREVMDEDLELGDEIYHKLIGPAYARYFFQNNIVYRKSFEVYGHTSEGYPTNEYQDKSVINFGQSICPKGWRLPTLSEARSLPYYYGVNFHNEMNDEEVRLALVDSPAKLFLDVPHYASYSTGDNYFYLAGYYYQGDATKNLYNYSTSTDPAPARCVLRW